MHCTSSLCVDSAFFIIFLPIRSFAFDVVDVVLRVFKKYKKVKERVPYNPASARSNTIPMRCSRHILPKDKRDLELHPVK